MSKRQDLAIELHDRKFNCAQAVACSFCKELGIDEEILFTAGEGFGLGMGGMQCTCGAVSGAVLAAGFKNSDRNPQAPATKAETYKLSKEIAKRFEEQNGSLICAELKGVTTGTVLRSCPDCIRDAVAIAQDVLGYGDLER